MEEKRPWGMPLKSFLILLHLSQFAGYIVPGGGFILPLVMWLTNREEFEEVNQHGKMVTNWIISSIIYFVVGFILMFILIGIPILIAAGILAIVFPIIGAVKADKGEFWEYPLTIKFIR